MIAIIFLACLGFGISVYAYFIEKKIKEDATYKPACDINDRFSCSKPINSQYGTIFFLSNSVWGMIYYTVVAVLAYMHAHTLLVLAVICGLIGSLGLAYLLYFKIKSICLVCTSLYIINALLVVMVLMMA